MSDRKVNVYRPIYEPLPGSIVTQAFILCSRCGAAFSSVSGPGSDAVCLACISRAALPQPDVKP